MIEEYFFRLFYAAPDTLIFADEEVRSTLINETIEDPWVSFSLGSGHRETNITSPQYPDITTARFILNFLKQCIVYQFHNTSETARIRQRWNIYDSRRLKEDGANLAPFLFRLYETKPKYYTRISETIRIIAPFFQYFVFDPLNDTLLLQWRERGTDMIFGPHQASDGTIRVMALIALLLQPEDELPNVIILDEPELGLHPYAINILAGLLQSVSIHTQVILATQSMTLIDYFDPGQIIVVERSDRSSTFQRLDELKLKDWLEEYSIAELWGKKCDWRETCMSIRLHIIVEGQTEETFVRKTLADHLGQFNISTAARRVETGRGKAKHVIYRGGLRTYQKVKKDLTLWMKGDQNTDAYFTTMFDLYALSDDFPAFEQAKQYTSPYDQVIILEEALLDDNQHPRFIPYIQLHEYEVLLFADPSQFDWEFIDNPQAIQELINIASSVASPELINDSPENAPSKRIIKLLPEYEGRKSSAGPLIAQKIGISTMRSKCHHFDEWLKKLESLTL